MMEIFPELKYILEKVFGIVFLPMDPADFICRFISSLFISQCAVTLGNWIAYQILEKGSEALYNKWGEFLCWGFILQGSLVVCVSLVCGGLRELSYFLKEFFNQTCSLYVLVFSQLVMFVSSFNVFHSLMKKEEWMFDQLPAKYLFATLALVMGTTCVVVHQDEGSTLKGGK